MTVKRIAAKVSETDSAPLSYYGAKTVQLPTEKEGPSDKIDEYTLFIYGMSGIGKTTFSGKFPDCLHVLFEPSAKGITGYKWYPQDWQEVLGLVETLEKEKGKLPYKTIAFDVIDWAWNYCSDYICNKNGIEVLKDLGWGDGYTRASTEFIRTLSKIPRAGYGLICISHAKMKSDEDDSNKIMVPSAMRSCYMALLNWCDIAGYYFKDENENYKLRIRPNEMALCKDRAPKNHFNWPDGSPIKDIPMGSNEDEAYNNFVSAFYNKLGRSKPQPKTKLTIRRKV